MKKKQFKISRFHSDLLKARRTDCDICGKRLGGKAPAYLKIRGLSTASFRFFKGRNDPRNFTFGEFICHIHCLPSSTELLKALNMLKQ